MYSLANLRDTMRRLAARAAGRSDLGAKLIARQEFVEGQEWRIAQLPVDITNYARLQTQDGTAFKFMLGWSALGGPDVLGDHSL